MQQKTNRLLVQARIQALETAVCESAEHQFTDQDDGVYWQVRWYLNTDRTLDLAEQGIASDQVNQKIWDEACREQDTIGVRIHFQVNMCTPCFLHFQERISPGVFGQAMIATPVGGVFLITSNRETYNVTLFVPFSVDIADRDILESLRKSTGE